MAPYSAAERDLHLVLHLGQRIVDLGIVGNAAQQGVVGFGQGLGVEPLFGVVMLHLLNDLSTLFDGVQRLGPLGKGSQDAFKSFPIGCQVLVAVGIVKTTEFLQHVPSPSPVPGPFPSGHGGDKWKPILGWGGQPIQEGLDQLGSFLHFFAGVLLALGLSVSLGDFRFACHGVTFD